MTLVFGNLPDGVDEKEMKSLMQRHNPSSIEFFDKTSSKHSLYECMVTFDNQDPIIGSIIEQHYNHLCWKGTCISVHRLIF